MKAGNLKLFYIHEALFQFSDTMLIIVLPIFIYKLFGSITAVFLYASIFFYPHLTFVWGIELINRFVTNMHQTIADSYLYAYSNKVHPIHFHLNREINLIFGRLASCGILAITFYFLPPNYLWLSIAVGSFMLLGWNYLKKSDHLLH